MWDEEDDDFCLPSGQGSPPSGFVRPDSSAPTIEQDVEIPWISAISDTAWLDDLPSTSTSMGKLIFLFLRGMTFFTFVFIMVVSTFWSKIIC